jgi:subtilisin family serine protease
MRHERPSNQGETRSSALWGKGSGGQSRGSALWGRGGRSGIALLALVVSVVIPAAGIAGQKQHAAVPADLIAAAQANPSAMFDVIVQGDKSHGTDDVSKAARENGGSLKRAFRSISGVNAEISGKDLLKLARNSHIEAITRNESLSLVGNGDWDVADPADAAMWRQVLGAPSLWDQPAVTCALSLLGVKLDPSCVPSLGSKAPQAPAIAIVDTGIDASKAADFGSRVVARANFSSKEPNATGDPSGHGTMVAGIAAGNGSVYPGVARNAPLVDVRVASSQGEALTSDIVAAVDWMLANKAAYNIRVANFSLVGTSAASFRFDPLDKAVEKLWFNGIVVVVAAGNNGNPANPVGIGAPANDPFVITVGALDIAGTLSVSDDRRASWSAYGPTADGFMKPDVSAPGRWIVGPVPTGSVIHSRKSMRVVAPGYMWMSGTSFAAPMAAGAAAQMLARNPGLSPDQVKGALMQTARYIAASDPGAGVGEIDAAAAASLSSAPNPNANLYEFVKDGSFDSEAWSNHVKSNANWTASNWTASNWTASNWTASNWVQSNWTQSNWVSSNWTASNWTASNWTVATDEE